MGYTVNPANLGAVFVVPTQVVDKHIKLASGQQLKLLLWMLRHSNEGFDLDRLCKDLNFNKDDALDYMQYWVETGVILCDDEIKPAPKESKTAVKDKQSSTDKKVKKEASEELKPKKEMPQIVHTKPTMQEIVQRAEESDEIRFLLRESQTMLGRTIGYDCQCSLLMLHDTYGLPVEVIIMIIEYAVSVGKSNSSYILALGRDWSEHEIDTIEKADEKISTLRTVNKHWAKFAAMARLSNSIPTREQEKYFSVWDKEWKFSLDMIYCAYEKMTNNCRKLSFPYMNKILKSWHADSITTVSDVEAYEKGKMVFSQDEKANKKTFTSNTKTSFEKNSSPENTSYDLEKFKSDAIHKPLVYNKKKKNP